MTLRKRCILPDCSIGIRNSYSKRIPLTINRRKPTLSWLRDGFAILKVGPALTYAMRQALFALATIEDICVPGAQRSNLARIVESAMIAQPGFWKSHYKGSEEEQRRLRISSYNDRIRYYWLVPQVKHAVKTLVSNLEQRTIPETLLSDYLPHQYEKVRADLLAKHPVALILDKITDALKPYELAC
jgi:D-tagatose-1,6-bisphosphate aldolase subunit GatZ/KbaZ